jgi:mRNA-degrading endonuclease RelE of RelBE toxin-antitoxin system
MEFRISDTFTASLAKLSGPDQKAVKTTAFDLQIDPSSPGLRYHRLDKAKDANFWSISVNMDVRLIVHKTESSVLLCYVDHHDKAYEWARNRKIEKHPHTGAAQLVEIRETVKQVIIPQYTVQPKAKPLLFAGKPDDELLCYGVPPEWLDDVKTADEDSILDISIHLPAEAAEALLDIAVGRTPRARYCASAKANAFDHPDAKRRFRIIKNIEELERALELPWEKWSVFLHPEKSRPLNTDRNFGIDRSKSR